MCQANLPGTQTPLEFPVMRFLLSLATFILGASASLAADPVPDSNRINGVALGCQAYSFRLFSLSEAIEKTAASGAKVIEFYPGQKLSKANPKGFSHDSPLEDRVYIKEQLKKNGLLVVAYGVVGLPANEKESRKVFDFAKDMGIRVINTEGAPDAFDTIEKLVKEYDIKVGLHNHPRRANNPNYKHWDPNWVLEMVRGRDKRIGACADTGHWIRSGLKPVDCIKILNGRVVSSHLKDLGEKLHDMPFGNGNADIAGILAEYRAQGMDGPVSIEYEHNWEKSLPEITDCVNFVKKWVPVK